VRNCLEKIEESSEHLLMLINGVLDLSRIESGKAECTATPIDICEVMDTALATMQGFLTNRNLNFQVERQISDPLYVLGDALRIREILVNILNNAVKFTDDGGTIVFRASQKPGEDERHTTVCLSVSDTGVGMSEEFRDRIFDEFSQEESGARTQYNGTGLGMPITKRYVEMMGGQIDVESEKWVGTTVGVELPMELVCVEISEKQEVSFAQEDLSGVHVLMAEDNELNAEIAEVQLEECGMQVTRVADGKAAVEAFVNNPAGTFDLILMDIMMPVMNGYDATRAIRGIGDRADASTIPIIAVTANAFAEDAQNAMDAGMDAHLAKPLVMDEVTKTIAGKVRKKRKNHEDH
ncbi:MAG: ATP-binding protein, partial [Lachnospiraceae bacterium]|nr:ATP-binding protein [Lachnospiraceae bacterium]